MTLTKIAREIRAGRTIVSLSYLRRGFWYIKRGDKATATYEPCGRAAIEALLEKGLVAELEHDRYIELVITEAGEKALESGRRERFV